MPTVPTKILPKNLLDKVKRSRPVYDAARRLRFALGERLGARPVEGLTGRVHYNDFMLASADPAKVERYRNGAMRFVDVLQRSVTEAGRSWDSIDAVLEVGCGYGRIVRELVKRLPPARIAVSDVIEGAANFTATEFGVRKVPPIEKAGDTLTGRFDLVYLLSVYTHLRRDFIEANLRGVAAALKPGGIAVMTVHGRDSANVAEVYEQYWLDKTRLLQALARDGYYYERYPYYYDEYGLTWFTREAFEKLVAETVPELSFVAYHPADLDVAGPQDVFVFRKA
jgi:SAM-dependent methyltransferase